MNSTPSDSMFNKFVTNSNEYINSTREFLKSESFVAKFAFLLVVLFFLIIFIRLGIAIITYFFNPTGNPRLIDGMVDAKQLVVIPQDVSLGGSIPITRSVNASEGIEFTWSTWIYIDDLAYNNDKYRCVFYKGNDFASNPNDDTQTGLNFPNNAPGLYITPNTNNLVIMMNTFNVINEQILVTDIPINKWLNIIIRCQNNTLDVYINGIISKSHNLNGVVKQNYGNVYIAPNGGFSGYISNLWYYNYALGTNEISKLVSGGPNTTMKSSNNNGFMMKKSDYLSLRWFFFGSEDAYNP